MRFTAVVLNMKLMVMSSVEHCWQTTFRPYFTKKRIASSKNMLAKHNGLVWYVNCVCIEYEFQRVSTRSQMLNSLGIGFITQPLTDCRKYQTCQCSRFYRKTPDLEPLCTILRKTCEILRFWWSLLTSFNVRCSRWLGTAYSSNWFSTANSSTRNWL